MPQSRKLPLDILPRTKPPVLNRTKKNRDAETDVLRFIEDNNFEEYKNGDKVFLWRHMTKADGKKYSYDQIDYYASPLYIASSEGNKEIVKKLLERGDAVDDYDAYDVPEKESSYLPVDIFEYQMAPLVVAVEKGHKDIVKMLLDKGADPDVHIRDWEGESPLRLASQYGYIDIVKMLLDKGANVEIGSYGSTDNEWIVPLSVASEKGHTDIVKMLLKKGADVNGYQDDPNFDAFKPLMLAVQNGHTDVVKLLLNKKKIDVNIENEDEENVLYVAYKKKIANEKQNNFEDKIFDMLIAAGATPTEELQQKLDRRNLNDAMARTQVTKKHDEQRMPPDLTKYMGDYLDPKIRGGKGKSRKSRKSKKTRKSRKSRK